MIYDLIDALRAIDKRKDDMWVEAIDAIVLGELLSGIKAAVDIGRRRRSAK